MASLRGVLHLLLLVLAICPLSLALKFDLHAGTKERCIRNFSSKNTLVVVTVTVGGQKGDGQVVNIIIRDAVGNKYQSLRDATDERRVVFTTLADAAFDVCFENEFSGRSHLSAQPTRHIELDVDIGADAKDWDTIKAAEKMKPVEADLRRIEEVTGEIVHEMEYLREREIKLRDTNESTNERVKWFAIGTMVVLVGLGAWQVLYLRAYFRSKHLI